MAYRSIKSELYLLIETIIKGGTYTDVNGTSHIYTGISAIKLFDFWNSDISNSELSDSFPVPALFLDFTNNNYQMLLQRTSDLSLYQTQKENCEFTLHLISPKNYSETRKNAYLDQIDLAAQIKQQLRNITVAGIKNINFISEQQDNNSQVLMDWNISFSCVLTEAGAGANVDGNLITPKPFSLSVQIIDQLNT